MIAEQPVQFIASPTIIPFLILPEVNALFSDRALRLSQLAPGHAMQGYLHFVASIATAQHEARHEVAQTALPKAEAGQPPLDYRTTQRDPAWHQVLKKILSAVADKAPALLATRLEALLAHTSADEFENLAQGYYEGDSARCDVGIMPIVAAALQVYWTSQASQLESNSINAPKHGQQARLCPVCGSHPVGSVIHTGAAHQGLRYLVCSLCSSQWNMERIRCVNCGDNKHVAYYGIEGADSSVQAECCDACHVYTKIANSDKNPAVESTADDLATLSLDILVGEAGYERYGLNPFLITEP